MIKIPEEYAGQFYNGSNEACDMLVGPCACGATHDIEEWLDVMKDLEEKNKVLGEALRDMYFAYINKDAEFPHGFEVAAIEQYEALFPKETKQEPIIAKNPPEMEVEESDLPIDYCDLVEFINLCQITPVYIQDEHRTLRFRANSTIGYLLHEHKKANKDGLNAVWDDAYLNDHTVKEMVELYIHMGYSLSGFEEIFGDAMNTILRIRYDGNTGNFIDKSGPSTETVKLINGPIRNVK